VGPSGHRAGNFTIFAPAVFTVFEDANQPFEFVTHVVFGLLLALAFFSSGTRRKDPVLAIAEREMDGQTQSTAIYCWLIGTR
jgi:hypothetical protein